MHSMTSPEPNQAGTNLMLNSPELAESLRLRIAILNYLGENSRLRRAAEDAEIRANDLQAWLRDVRRENDVLRQLLGLPYRDWGPLPTPYPDSDVAKLLAAFCRVDQTGADIYKPYYTGPRKANPLPLEGCRNFYGTVR